MKKVILSAIGALTAMGCMAAEPEYRGFADFGYSFGTGMYGFPQLMINTTHGLDLVPGQFFVGAGTGVGIAAERQTHTAVSVPVYADARYTFTRPKVKPTVDLKAGYGFVFKESGYRGGLYFAPTAGVSFGLASRSELHVGLGYVIQNARCNSNDTFNAGGFLLTAGVSF